MCEFRDECGNVITIIGTEIFNHAIMIIGNEKNCRIIIRAVSLKECSSHPLLILISSYHLKLKSFKFFHKNFLVPRMNQNMSNSANILRDERYLKSLVLAWNKKLAAR